MTNIKTLVNEIDEYLEIYAKQGTKDKLRGAALIGKITSYEDLGALSSKEAQKYINKISAYFELTSDEWDQSMLYGGGE